MVEETDKELKKLTDQFIRVRVVQMGGVDLSVFQFDPMLSWSVFLMNADKTIYGRFGRAHPRTKRDKKDSNPNPTLEGLRAALSKALWIHEQYRVNPKDMGPRLAGKTGPAPRWRYAEKTPAARKYGRLQRITEGQRGCVHCHEVLRTAIDSHFFTKKRIPDKMLWLYPRPHVLGLRMDNKAVATVAEVGAGSIAAKAGIQVGDHLVSLDDQPLVSIADIQWVLHNVPDKGGQLPCTLMRHGETEACTLELPKDWRFAEDFGWRYRMAGYAAWLWAGVSIQDDPKGIRVVRRAPSWFKRENKEAKKILMPNDIITVVDGKKGLDRSKFLAYLMRDKKLGSKVKLTVLRKGDPVELTFRVPKKQPEVQGH